MFTKVVQSCINLLVYLFITLFVNQDVFFTAKTNDVRGAENFEWQGEGICFLRGANHYQKSVRDLKDS